MTRSAAAPRERSVPGPRLVHCHRSRAFTTVSSGGSFVQVAGAILRKQARGQNPDKDEAAGSSAARPTTPALSCGNACQWSPSTADASVRHLCTAVSERIPARCSGDFGLSMERGGSGHPVRGLGWGRILLEHPCSLCLAKGGNASLAGLAIFQQAEQSTSS
jgi:hypothetical protein